MIFITAPFFHIFIRKYPDIRQARIRKNTLTPPETFLFFKQDIAKLTALTTE